MGHKQHISSIGAGIYSSLYQLGARPELNFSQLCRKRLMQIPAKDATDRIWKDGKYITVTGTLNVY